VYDIITTVSNEAHSEQLFISSRFVIPFRKTASLGVTAEEEAAIRQAVSDRLAYLDEVFDEDAEKNIERYKTTKQLITDIFAGLSLRKAPYIGVDGNGQVEAFWYDGDEYAVISLIPVSEKKIIVTCLKDSGTVITAITSLENMKKNRGKELAMPWKEILG
jgi:hypothetical protein